MKGSPEDGSQRKTLSSGWTSKLGWGSCTTHIWWEGSQWRGWDSEYIEEKGNNHIMNKGMNYCAEGVEDVGRVLLCPQKIPSNPFPEATAFWLWFLLISFACSWTSLKWKHYAFWFLLLNKMSVRFIHVACVSSCFFLLLYNIPLYKYTIVYSFS